MELLTMAIVAFGLLGAAVALRRHEQAFDKLETLLMQQISGQVSVKKEIDKRIDSVITIHNSSIDHYDDEIDQIIARMDQITADIERIDREQKDLRTYYVNYREPLQDNSGVNWSKSYVVTEDYIYEEHQKDNKIQD
jgi:Skp family chaperone for outer membrane proteins